MLAVRCTLLLLSLGLLASCSDHQSSTADTERASQSANAQTPQDRSVQDSVSDALRNAGREARAKLEAENLKLSASGSLPRAEITPEGAFLIDGKPIKLAPDQQKLMLEYRSELIQIAQAGIDIGMQGADLGVRAAKDAVLGALSGKGDQVKQDIEAQASRIEASAAALCSHLPALRATQEKLAVALPVFAPYAKVDQADIDDCSRDVAEDSNGGAREEAPSN